MKYVFAKETVTMKGVFAKETVTINHLRSLIPVAINQLFDCNIKPNICKEILDMCFEAHENQQDFANGPLTINHVFIQRPIKTRRCRPH